METIPTPAPVLAAIGRKHLGIQSLITANSDSKDFYDLAVWNIRAALEAAFLMGQQAIEEH